MYGGVERHVHEIGKRLVQAGHEVVVYGRAWYAPKHETTVDGIQQVFLPSLHTKHLDTITHVFLATIHALIKKTDVIHYHGVGPALMAWLPRLFSPQTRVVVTFHSIDRYHQKWNATARFFLRLGEWAACAFAHKTIAVSQSLTQYCYNEFGTVATYIPNGATASPTCGASPEPLHVFGLAPKKYMVVVTRLVRHKGVHTAIEAFLAFKKAHPEQELKLAIVGDSVHTDAYVQELRTLAADRADIVFTGFQHGDTLCALYRHAALMVHPSSNEGLPLTVLEAMAHGAPTVVSNIPEHRELIDNPLCFAEAGSVSSLQFAMERFFALTESERAAIGEAGRLTAETKYNWDDIARDLALLYEAPASAPCVSPIEVV